MLKETPTNNDLAAQLAAELFAKLWLDRRHVQDIEFLAREAIEGAKAFARVLAERRGS